MKDNKVCIFFHHDVIEGDKFLPYWKIKTSSLKSNVREFIRNANLVVYKDGYDVKVLKSRYFSPDNDEPTTPLNDERLITICRKQQKMLSQILDNLDRYNLSTNETVSVINTLKYRQYHEHYRDDLNGVKKKFFDYNLISV